MWDCSLSILQQITRRGGSQDVEIAFAARAIASAPEGRRVPGFWKWGGRTQVWVEDQARRMHAPISREAFAGPRLGHT